MLLHQLTDSHTCVSVCVTRVGEGDGEGGLMTEEVEVEDRECHGGGGQDVLGGMGAVVGGIHKQPIARRQMSFRWDKSMYIAPCW